MVNRPIALVTRIFAIPLMIGLMLPFIIGVASAQVPSDQTKQSLKTRVDELAQPYVDSATVVGMTIGILKGDQEACFGYGSTDTATPNDTTTPSDTATPTNTPDEKTIYEIGSISKVFTSLLLANAVTRGEVQLDQPVGDLLPAHVKMPIRKPDAPITLKHLSTHTSGLPRLPDNLEIADLENPYANYTDDQLYDFLNRHSLRKIPGTHTAYSNLGAGLLGNLLAKQQKTTYQDLLKKRIAVPLEMTDTTIELNESQQSRLAKPHLGGGVQTSNWDVPVLTGAGAIRSTTSDMLKFAKAQLSPPNNDLGHSIELAWKLHQKPLQTGQHAMGLGWQIAHDGSTRWHNGQTGGYHSMMLINRQHQCAVVLLTNTATGAVDQLAEQTIRMLMGVKETPRTFAKSIDVPQEVMERYVGKYQLAPGFIFTVTTKENRLMVGLTGQPAYRVYPKSETEWFYKVVEATLTFEVDANNECKSVELFQNGVRQKAVRLKE